MTLPLPTHIGPIIGFVPDVYSVQEDDGSVVFNVRIIRGFLERDVSVTFMTQSGTATEEGRSHDHAVI